MAKLYLATLALVVLVFPFIFGAAFMLLTAVLIDGTGLPRHLGRAGLALYGVFCFVAILFFSAFAWPHVSSRVGRAFDVLVGGAHD